MSVSSSLQQLAGGLGSIIAGMIVVQETSGKILHFETIGYVMTGIALVALVMVFYINRFVSRAAN
ncbi:hypothetical protein D3C72_1463970 [compost metagenome]